MCAHYEAPKRPEIFRSHFGVDAPTENFKGDVWPGYLSAFIRTHEHADTGDDAVPERQAMIGSFGLIPHWAKDTKIARNTYNARSETVSEKPSFRDAWKTAKHCIIPAMAIYEPDWRSGKAKATRISRADGQPMGIAGLWAWWRTPTGEDLHSFTMLTINADQHSLMRHFHKPEDEKRMVVILPPERYRDWLQAQPQDSMDFMRPFASDYFQAE
jgi:putative SOS response-associated peptidase YedK